MRILIVDDLVDNRELYAAYFELSGHDVTQASDGAQALVLVDRNAPDVVIMDLSMPRVDGWEATRAIKSNPKTRHVTVVVLTAHHDQDVLDRARAAGADDVRTKPCLPSELAKRIDALFARR